MGEYEESMNIDQKYQSINLLDLIEMEGESAVNARLSSFACPKNPDVENFLQRHAAEFTRKSQSVTYLVMDVEALNIVGYYTLAIKPLAIPAGSISKTLAKKVARVSTLDSAGQIYSTAAYLIAQLGKNSDLPVEKCIEGRMLLHIAMNEISLLKRRIGGLIQFLECEDNAFLLNFYQSNGFQVFDTRVTSSEYGTAHKLYQLLRKID